MKTFQETAARFLANRPDSAPEPEPESGYVPDADRAFLELLLCLRVPKRYHAIRRSMELLPQIAAWRGEPWALTLLGETGTGKTWQAIRLLAALYEERQREFVWAKHRPFFADCSLALEQIKREMNVQGERGATFEALCRAEILLLDDYGAERSTEFHADQLSLILRSRYNDQLPTILTSNFTSLEPIAQTEPKIASRLSEGGNVFVIPGVDRRLSA